MRSCLCCALPSRSRELALELGEELPQSVSLKLGNAKEKFGELDQDIAQNSANETLISVFETIPPRGVDHGPKRNFTEMALIKNELAKKRRIAIRDLVRRATAALLALNLFGLESGCRFTIFATKKRNV